LEEYEESSAPQALVKDCRRRLDYYAREAAKGMYNLDIVVQGIKYFDYVMSEAYALEREMYEEYLPAI
jgi:hypothetical protein